jgi:L-iditol 2-dehydrogenase
VRAVVLDADGLPEVADLEEPTGPGLLVRVRGCGLCGSDVEKIGRVSAGTVLGHEVEGELEDGARVAVVHHVPCGECQRCRAGHGSTCGEFRWNRIDPGGFAERLRATHCVPLPPSLDELAGVFVEPLACVLRAVERVPRGRVLVVGCGAIGQLFVQVLVARGDEVEAVDPRRERLAHAVALGAGVSADPVDAAVVTAHDGVNDALARLEPGGTLVVFAAPEGRVPVDLGLLYRHELTAVGSRSATLPYFKDAIELMPQLELPETRVLPLDRFLEGVELYRRGEATKVVFRP